MDAPPYRRSRLADALVASGTGIVCSWAVLQSFVNYSGFLVPGWVPIAVFIGGVLAAVATSLTGVPQFFARANADFWGGGAFTRAVVIAAFCAIASIVWGMALVSIFGTRPDG